MGWVKGVMAEGEGEATTKGLGERIGSLGSREAEGVGGADKISWRSATKSGSGIGGVMGSDTGSVSGLAGVSNGGASVICVSVGS